MKIIMKAIGIILAGIVLLAAILFGAVLLRPSIVTDALQSLIYQDKSDINPSSPRREPGQAVRSNGILYVNDIKYGETYPNSYLDISYPSSDTSVKRTTVIYFHGGGFFAGDKVLGDPMAERDDSTALFDKMIQAGFNFVNVNYVLMPDYHFPDPLIQISEAVNYLVEHGAELGLDMEDVVLFGQSAGAELAAQYAAVLSNGEYRALFAFTKEPRLQVSDIRAAVIDDAPLEVELLEGLPIKILAGAYLQDSVFLWDKAEADRFSATRYITPNYPRSFLTAGTDDGFPEIMQHFADRLAGHGVEHEYFYTDEATYGLTKHGFLSNTASRESQDCFEAMLRFIREEQK